MTGLNPDLEYALRRTSAVVLAGGRGSRLHDLGTLQAKPAVSFGGSHRLIDFPLSNCINSGIRRVGVATQYRAQSLIQHLHLGWGFLHRDLGEYIDPWPAEQGAGGEGWYKGTADAVFRNLEHLATQSPAHVLVLAGDHVYKQDYRRMLADHVEKDADVTVSCVDVPVSEANGFGIVATDKTGTITAFVEKPERPPTLPGSPGTCLASMGIYLFKASFLADLLYEDHHNPASGHDFGHDLLPRLVGWSKLHAHRFSNSCMTGASSDAPYWRDVGTLDAYWRTNLDLTRARPPLDLFDSAWPIRTATGQRSPARVTMSADCRHGLVRNAVLAPGANVEDAHVTDSILSLNVSVAPQCRIEESVLLPGAKVAEGTSLRRTIVSEGCDIPAGMTVGMDADEDARWFTRTSSGITLVTPKGLQQRAIGRKMMHPGRRFGDAVATRPLQPDRAGRPAPRTSREPNLSTGDQP